MTNCSVALAVLLSVSAWAQRPQFDVASIKMYPPGASRPQGGSNGFKIAPDGVDARYMRLWGALAWAYDVPGSVFGPDWVSGDRFDIAAKAAGPVAESELKLMVQTLLENRFQLKLHREMRDLPVAVLEAAKSGLKNLAAIQTSDPEKTNLRTERSCCATGLWRRSRRCCKTVLHMEPAKKWWIGRARRKVRFDAEC
jgi:uncharacterized protein (TIGR03435 family)